MTKFFVILFFIILPFGGAYFLFWHDVGMSVDYQATKDSKVAVTVHREKLLQPNIKNTIRKIFQSPFDLAYYKLCFKNTSKATEEGTEEPLDTIINFEDLSGENINIDPLKIKGNNSSCINLNSSQIIIGTDFIEPYQFKYFGPVKFDINIFPENNATPVFYEQIALSAIFYLSMIGIWMLFLSIWGLFVRTFKRPTVPHIQKLIS
jgi:hypothetical protein